MTIIKIIVIINKKPLDKKTLRKINSKEPYLSK